MKTLFENLKDLEYTASLEGENIRLRYRGVGKHPPEAAPLIEELRARKAEAVQYLKAQRPLPYFEADGSLTIPFGSDPRFQYWREGQALSKTEKEVRAWLH